MGKHFDYERTLEFTLLELYWIRHDAFCDLYRKLKSNGMDEIELDGTIFGYPGDLMIEELIEYFVSLECYEKCIVLRNLLSDLRKRNDLYRNQRNN